jgi:hypothetical protein
MDHNGNDMVAVIGEKRVDQIFDARQLSPEDKKAALDILSEWKGHSKPLSSKIKVNIVLALGDIVREFVDKRGLISKK